MQKITAEMTCSFFSAPAVEGGAKPTLSKIWALSHTSAQLVSPDPKGKFDKWLLLLQAFVGVFTEKDTKGNCFYCVAFNYCLPYYYNYNHHLITSGGVFDEVRYECVIEDDYRLSEDEARALFIAVEKADAYTKELQDRAKARNSPAKRSLDEESSPSSAALVTPKKIPAFNNF